MRPCQRERRLRVIKCCAGPIGGAVANRTIQRKAGLGVVWIGCSVIQRNVARIAILGRVGEVRACMALVTLQRRVRPR